MKKINDIKKSIFFIKSNANFKMAISQFSQKINFEFFTLPFQIMKKVNLTIFIKLQSSKTWTQMTKNSTNVPDANQIKMKQKLSKSSNEVKITKKKNKRLIIILKKNIFKFDSYEFRKKINTILKTIKCDVQIFNINKNVSRNNIVMTIVKSNTINHLIQHRSIWNNIIKSKYVIKNKI